jgi:hypothetical protein
MTNKKQTRREARVTKPSNAKHAAREPEPEPLGQQPEPKRRRKAADDDD